MDKVYVDSNIFIYGALNDDQRGDQARTVLNDISTGERHGYTSALTYDEVCWQLTNKLDSEPAQKALDVVIDMPNLSLIEANTHVIRDAHSHVFSHGFDPRDAIHLASMNAENITTIITSDQDFHNNDALKAIPPEEYIKRHD
jgi:predicted nucleic acid-binding protein